jgi:hypothetical protein
VQADDLTREQAAALKNKLRPMLDYLGRLNKRLSSRGFPENDPLRVMVSGALTSMHQLFTEVHCRSIDRKGSPEMENAPPVDLLFTRTSKPRKHERH